MNLVRALDINWTNSVESIPLASAIIDEESKIKFSNTLFRDIFNLYDGDIISSFYIEKDSYIYEDEIFDWKDILLNSDSQEKVLVNLYEQEVEFEINLKKIDEENLYMVCFHAIENRV